MCLDEQQEETFDILCETEHCSLCTGLSRGFPQEPNHWETYQALLFLLHNFQVMWCFELSYVSFVQMRHCP